MYLQEHGLLPCIHTVHALIAIVFIMRTVGLLSAHDRREHDGLADEGLFYYP